MAKRYQKSFESLAQIRLKTNILLKDQVNQVGLVKVELSEVSEVNLHGGLLVLLNLLSLVHIKADSLSLIVSICIVVIICVFFAQLKS
jgi:hypothetical protein